MTEVDPAVAHIQCSQCEEIIDIEIPVSVELRTSESAQYMSVGIDDTDWSPQALWDHQLSAHGPKI
jgi:Fe2+ or Zn2+ uptake regulation protein